MTAVSAPAGWRCLRTGGGGAVLAVDFGPRSGRPGFSRLAQLLGDQDGLDPAVYETVPPKLGPHLDHWLSGLRAARPDVRAVLAFCAGSR